MDADRHRPPQGLRRPLKIEIMQCDFVVFPFLPSLPHEERRLHIHVHQHDAWVFVVRDGSQITHAHLFECQSGMLKFVLVFRSSLWLGPLNSQEISRTRISSPGNIFDDLFNFQDVAFLWRARCSSCSCSRNSACLTHSCQASPAISVPRYPWVLI